MPDWTDRRWIPTPDETELVSTISGGIPGEVLLRLIDGEMQLVADDLLTQRSEGVEHYDLQELNRARGRYQALQLVVTWLTQERDSEPESQETDNG